jgi:hypothetical protein
MLSCGNNDGSVRSYFPSWKETLHLYNSSRNERKEEWKPPHRALNKSSRNKFFDDILFNIPLSYELTSSSFPLPNLDHPHQNILSYAYPLFTAFALRYVQATEYAKNWTGRIWAVLYLFVYLDFWGSRMAKSLMSMVWGRGFNSHLVHFFLWWKYGIKLSSFWLLSYEPICNKRLALIMISRDFIRRYG